MVSSGECPSPTEFNLSPKGCHCTSGLSGLHFLRGAKQERECRTRRSHFLPKKNQPRLCSKKHKTAKTVMLMSKDLGWLQAEHTDGE